MKSFVTMALALSIATLMGCGAAPAGGDEATGDDGIQSEAIRARRPARPPTQSPARPRPGSGRGGVVVPPGGTHSGPASLYPNPSLTPGAVMSGVTVAQICTPGYTKTVRNVPTAVKQQVFQRYGTTFVAGAFEVDHFISLELGGSNDISNLWPEPYAPPPGAHEKDAVENYLHKQLCSGAMTLQQVQTAITNDWYAVYKTMSGHP